MKISNYERAARFGQVDWAFKDLKGERFGRLTVLGRDGRDTSGHICWRCRCSCGREVVVVGTSLRLQRTRSCKCLMIERRRARWHAKMCSRNTNKISSHSQRCRASRSPKTGKGMQKLNT